MVNSDVVSSPCFVCFPFKQTFLQSFCICKRLAPCACCVVRWSSVGFPHDDHAFLFTITADASLRQFTPKGNCTTTWPDKRLGPEFTSDGNSLNECHCWPGRDYYAPTDGGEYGTATLSGCAGDFELDEIEVLHDAAAAVPDPPTRPQQALRKLDEIRELSLNVGRDDV